LLKDIILEAAETDATEFTVSYWKVDKGAEIHVGDELVVVESVDDKTALAVLSRHTGTLAEILAQEDASVAAGDALGRIDVE
jgi:pyruvate/2-oxoglutarate dehydrogenase complex dihydrolipoamide acyltransferase (E2) component